MLLIGLTGGIGSGKSTVAAMLRDQGIRVVDADQIAREVVEPGQPALAELVEVFGQDILNDDGSLNRSMPSPIHESSRKPSGSLTLRPPRKRTS